MMIVVRRRRGMGRLDPDDGGNGGFLALSDHRCGPCRPLSAGPRGTAASPSGSGETRAEGVLDQRFARGEIDENEYRQRLSLLREYP